jgi:hypothetical protein
MKAKCFTSIGKSTNVDCEVTDSGNPQPLKSMSGLAVSQPTKQEQQIQELQDDLAAERDARREDQFVFIMASVILFDIVFFTSMPTSAGPISIVVLQLLVLLPLARKMGMDEIATILNGVIARLAGKS